jgi:uncharacterized protein YdhG (YjbR/CyaY superfamily)
MESPIGAYRTIEEYIAQFPQDIQERLEAMRATIRATAPEAKERIAYQMPTFTFYGNLVHFAAFKNHIGFYPRAIGVTSFQDELVRFGAEAAGGTVRFPHDKPLPLDLIGRIVAFRVNENLNRLATRAERRQD